MVLKRASRSTQDTACSRHNAQPMAPATFIAHRYMIKAGATPKLMASARESSSAPNLLVPRNSRATRPSTPSSIAAAASAITARSHCAFMA